MSRVAAEVSNERALPAPRLRLAVAQLVRSVIMTASILPDSLTSSEKKNSPEQLA
jgi:hypothetical protein